MKKRTRFKILIACAFLLGYLQNGIAQTKYWNHPNGPYGAFAMSLAIDPAGGLYVGTMTQGLYKSADGGYTWKYIGLEGTTVNKILPLTDKIIFAGTDAGIYKTNDSGNNWSFQNITSGVTSIYATSNGSVLMGTRQQILRTTDMGVTWQNVTTGMLNVSVTSFAQGTGEKLFAAAGKAGLLVSTNDGVSWSASGTGLPEFPGASNNVASIIFSKDDKHIILMVTSQYYTQAGWGKGIYLSTDNGISWEKKNEIVSGISQFATSSNGYLLAGFYDGTSSGSGKIAFSDDFGTTWKDLPGTNLNRDVRALITSRDGNILAGNYYGGLMLSTDNGITWTSVNTGINNSDITAVYASPTGSLFCSRFSRYDFYSGVYRSKDDGNSWKRLNTGNNSPNVRTFFTSKKGTLFAGDFGIYRSTNDGDDWQIVKSSYSLIYSFTETPRGTIIAGDNSWGIFRSTNDGLTWKESNAGLTRLEIFSLTTTQTGEILALSVLGKIYRSTDDGMSWQIINTPTENAIVSLYKTNGNTLLAGTYGRVLVSQDDGNTWQLSSTLNKEPVNIIVENSLGYLFAGCAEEGVYISKDNGNTWKMLSTEGLSDKRVQTICISNTDYIFVGTWRGSLFKSTLTSTEVKRENEQIPSGYMLEQNYPNPFNPETTISYTVRVASQVSLKVYDVLGREVATLLNEYKQPGVYYSTFYTLHASTSARQGGRSSLTSGIYFYTLKAGNFVQTKKMVYLK